MVICGRGTGRRADLDLVPYGVGVQVSSPAPEKYKLIKQYILQDAEWLSGRASLLNECRGSESVSRSQLYAPIAQLDRGQTRTWRPPRFEDPAGRINPYSSMFSWLIIFSIYAFSQFLPLEKFTAFYLRTAYLHYQTC